MPIAGKYLKWLGACYILWLGYNIFRSGYSDSGSVEKNQAFMKGLFLQLLNPKFMVKNLVIYTTFLAPLSENNAYLLLTAIGLTAIAFVSISLWTLFGSVVKLKLKRRLFRNIFRTVMILLLVYTAVDLAGAPFF